MGIDPISLAIISVAATVITGVGQLALGAEAAAAQKEAGAIQKGQGEVDRIQSIRRNARAVRAAKANIQQAAFNTGASGGSGETSAVSSLRSKLDESIAVSSGQVKTAEGVSNQLQRKADADFASNTLGALNNMFQTGIKTGQQAYNAQKVFDRAKIKQPLFS